MYIQYYSIGTPVFEDVCRKTTVFLEENNFKFAVGDDSLLEVLQRAEEHFHDSREGTVNSIFTMKPSYHDY